MVAGTVLGKQDEVVIRRIRLALLLLFLTGGDIDLTAEDRFEVLAFSSKFVIFFLAVIEELLDAHHIAVIGYGNAAHTVGDGLVNHLGNARLPVKQRVLGVDVKMNEILHTAFEKGCKVTHPNIFLQARNNEKLSTERQPIEEALQKRKSGTGLRPFLYKERCVTEK